MTLNQAGHLPPDEYPRLAQGYSLFFDRLERHLTET